MPTFKKEYQTLVEDIMTECDIYSVSGRKFPYYQRRRQDHISVPHTQRKRRGTIILNPNPPTAMQKVCETIGLFNAEYLAVSDIPINTHTN